MNCILGFFGIYFPLWPNIFGNDRFSTMAMTYTPLLNHLMVLNRDPHTFVRVISLKIKFKGLPEVMIILDSVTRL